MAEKLVFMITHGIDHPEHVTIPFVMATAAQASDVEVVIGLQADGVWLGTKGGGDAVTADGFPPLAKLMNDYKEMGGKLLVCNPCMKSRGIDPATQLADNAEVVAAGRFVAEVTSATNVLTY
jgi:predicted peroxiredoxin